MKEYLTNITCTPENAECSVLAGEEIVGGMHVGGTIYSTEMGDCKSSMTNVGIFITQPNDYFEFYFILVYFILFYFKRTDEEVQRQHGSYNV